MSNKVVQEVVEVPAGNIYTVSNVRMGDLPNIEQLAVMMRPPVGRAVEEGQKTPLHLYQVSDYIDALEESIGTSKEGPELDEMMDRLNVVTELPNPEGFICIDGHRRLAAGAVNGYTSFKAIVLPAKASVSELVLDQAIYGLSAEALDLVEEGSVYQKLRDYGWTQKEIWEKMGKSKGHVQQRLKISSHAEKIEELGTESVLNYLDALRNGEIPVQVANKVAQYGKENASLDNINWMLDLATGKKLTGDEFVEKINERLGHVNKPVKTAPAEAPAEQSEPRTRTMRPEKDIVSQLDKWEMLSQIGAELKVPKADQAKASAIVEALKFVQMGTPPSAPKSLDDASKEYDAEQEKERQLQAEARKEENKEKNAGKKAKRDAEAAARKIEVDAWKLLMSNSVNPLIQQNKKSKKQVERAEELIAALKDENHEYWGLKEGQDPSKQKVYPGAEDAAKKIAQNEKKIAAITAAMEAQKDMVVATRRTANLQKPAHFVASEIKRFENAIKRNENLLEDLRNPESEAWTEEKPFPADAEEQIEKAVLKLAEAQESLEEEREIEALLLSVS